MEGELCWWNRMLGHGGGIVDGYSALVMDWDWRLLQHVGSSEVNCLWIKNTLNSERWTLNPELWTLNPGRGSCNKVGSLKRISVLLTSLSNVGVLYLEVCCPIFGTFYSAPRYFQYNIDRSEFSVGPVPHSMTLEMLEMFWNGCRLLLPWTRLLQQGRISQTDFRAVNFLNSEPWTLDEAPATAFTKASDGNRALFVNKNWRQLWLTKKDWWLMVAKVLGIGREMDGWSDLGCGERGGGKCLKVLIC